MALRAIQEEDAPSYDGKAQPATEGFTIIPAVVRTMKDGYAVAVFEAIARHANQSGEAWPSVATICELTGWSKKIVSPAIQRLIEAGALVKEKRQLNGMDQSNRYRITANVRVVPTVTPVVPMVTLGGSHGDLGCHPQNHELEPLELEPLEPDPPLPPKGEPTKAERDSRIPDDFEVTDEMQAWAVAKLIPPAVIEAQTEAFTTYWRGESGQRAKKRNWAQAWRTWMLRWLERHPQKPIDRSDWPLPEPFRLRWQMFQDERTGMGHPPAAQYPATLQADIEHWRATGEVRMLRPIRAVAS